MTDSVSNAWDKFFDERSKPLIDRFPGVYRAIVVETNDPLNIGRIRFKCPDMHDFDLKPDDCPWAVYASDMGGKGSARFVSPSIGDWVWITFEKQHPYGPVWFGHADPTRTGQYAHPQIHQKTQQPLNESGQIQDKPIDYDEAYLPKDGRPMAHGWCDRYGHVDIHSSVGYYPSEHDVLPANPDYDPVQNQSFSQQQLKPVVNSPDKKYMARITKYGHIYQMSDSGYYWKRIGELGEFHGDFDKDDTFERDRWLYLQKLMNEGSPDADNRKQILLTRYGHKIEMRDVGWAQFGPSPSKSRAGEYGDPQYLSEESERDQRWIKIRTKGGMLFQACDKGFDPENDVYIQRPLIDECGSKSENEDDHWGSRDARWMRLVTRYGYKIVLDDRGSSPTNASGQEDPRGFGVLIKGRRSPGSKNLPASGNQKGFHWEFNERDDANHSTWCSPLGQTIEINDRYQYIMMAASLGDQWASDWAGVADNEFIGKPSVMGNPEVNSHHLKIDHDNEYIRLKTRRAGTDPNQAANPSGISDSEINQGIEMRNGQFGDGPWVEMVDCQRRGFWFSKKYGLSIWRGMAGAHMFQWFDEPGHKIVIYNSSGSGAVEIFAGKEINIISRGDVHIQADGKISVKSASSIDCHAGATTFSIAENKVINCNAVIKAKGFSTTPLTRQVARKTAPSRPQQIEPTDRGQTYNKPYERSSSE